jgi:hypothetical protein
MEHEPGTLEAGVLCRVYELLEEGEERGGLIEYENLELPEKRARGGDSRKKCLQVSAISLESKPAKVRKCDRYHERLMQQIPLNFTEERALKDDYESLQLW